MTTENNTPWETDITPVNSNIAELEHRNRPHLPAHSRNIGEQTLDAMLRIEETLVSILEGMRFAAKQLTKTEAPVEETPAPKGKRK